METSQGATQSALSAFARGATQPSWPALFLTMGVAFTALSAITNYLDEDAFLRNSDLFRQCTHDDRVSATARILKLARQELDRPVAFFVGDSSDPNPIDLTKLEYTLDASNTRAQLVDLRTTGQTLWETTALLDRIPRHATGLVVIDVAPTRLQVSPEHIETLLHQQPFGFRSRAADRELQLTGRKARSLYGNYFLDNQSFLLPRLPYAMRNLVLDPPATCAPPETHLQPNEESFRNNLAILQRMTDKLLRQSHMDCLLLDVQTSSPNDWSDPALAAEYEHAIDQLAQSPRIHRIRQDEPNRPTKQTPEQRIAHRLRPPDPDKAANEKQDNSEQPDQKTTPQHK